MSLIPRQWERRTSATWNMSQTSQSQANARDCRVWCPRRVTRDAASHMPRPRRAWRHNRGGGVSHPCHARRQLRGWRHVRRGGSLRCHALMKGWRIATQRIHMLPSQYIPTLQNKNRGKGILLEQCISPLTSFPI